MDRPQSLPHRLTWVRHLSVWPFLVAPLLLAGALVHARYDVATFNTLQVHLETVAPYLVGAAAAVFAVRAAVTRSPLALLAAALATVFLLREARDATIDGVKVLAWMKRGVYVGMAAVGVWGWLWRRRLAGWMGNWRQNSLLLAAFTAYALSQVIARRAFRFIPGEHGIHRSLEECAETAAHLVFLLAAAMGPWRRPAAPDTIESAKPR